MNNDNCLESIHTTLFFSTNFSCNTQHLHIHTQKLLLQLLAVMRTWQSQDACALSRHYEPCKQRSWSRARNSQENRPFLTASGVGTRSPTWTIAVSWEKALNLHPSKCQVPNHSWVDWWGWWEADRKLPELGLNSQALSQGHNHYTTHTHTHTHLFTWKTQHKMCISQVASVVVFSIKLLCLLTTNTQIL